MGVSADRPNSIADLADVARAALEALASPLVSSFLADWPAVPQSRRVDPTTLPVLRCLSTLTAATAAVAPELVDTLQRSASTLAWRQTYTAHELGADFLDNYAYTEILGLNGPRFSDRLASGFLLLAADTLYPRHRHAAEEIYLPLVGTAEWQQGDTVWRSHPAGTVIHHRSEEAHAMRTRAEPLLALYLWRGDLAQKSRLAG
jgi:hypothetical protein